ncbi:MAG TPA: PorV/PorQ family protein [Candidatus Goldiibacteriota bacterium]|nr:PorV/PorQ family protein [Candidatus Goldiibacteriota bacterium]
MKKSILFFISLFLLSAGSVFAVGAGSTGLNFIKISQGARQAGMGEAFTGIADDVNAVFWNPAGLSQLTRHQACLMHSVWMLDVNFEYGAYAFPLGELGTIGIYGVYLNAGEILKTEEDSLGNPIFTEEKVGATNFNITLAYGRKLSAFFGKDSVFSDFAAGLSVNISSEDIAGDAGGGYGLNLSTLFNPRYENYSFGMSVENVGFSNNRPSLPLAVRLGFGYRFALENVILPFTDEGAFIFPDNSAAAGLDVIVYPTEQIVRFNAGVEKMWTLNKYHSVGVRAGYKFLHDLGFAAGITAGLGYKLTAGEKNSIEIDYSLNPYGDLGLTHRISLTGKFLGEPETRKVQDKQTAAEYYRSGYDLLYAKKYQEALAEFTACLKRDNEYTSAYIGVGSCFLNMGKPETALKAYEKALELNPENEKLRQFIEKQKTEKFLNGQQNR